MDKVSFSKVEAECGCVGEFVDLLLKKGHNISITATDTDFEVSFISPTEGEFVLKKPKEIIVHPVELPNGDIVWSQDAEEDKKILERWSKMMD